MTPGLRERKKNATRQALHEAALRLAIEHGADRVTVEAIADDAGVSRRTFSNYFASKEQALLHGDHQRIRVLIDAVHARPAAESPWVALTNAAEELYEGLRDLDPQTVAQGRLVRSQPALAAQQVNIFAALERELAAEVAGRLDEPDPTGGTRTPDRRRLPGRAPGRPERLARPATRHPPVGRRPRRPRPDRPRLHLTALVYHWSVPVEHHCWDAAGMTDVRLRVGQPLSDALLNELFTAAWEDHRERPFGPVLERSLTWVSAWRGERLAGFVNVATDGGMHAFLLDTTVHPDEQRQGLGRRLVRAAAEEATRAGADWLHVDDGPHLAGFYRGCGFTPTAAGVWRLR
jgi:AcrR family transcriptional regulator/GNAT superfamily N-acetyltransferase